VSTHINGRIVNLDIESFYKELTANIAPILREKMTLLTHRHLGEMLATRFDQISLGKVDPGKDENALELLKRVRKECADQEARDKDSRFFGGSYSIEIVMFPDNGETLFVPLSDEPKLIAELDSNPLIKPYQWWDHSDGPEDVSPCEWARREKRWKRIIGKSWTLESGISYRAGSSNCGFGIDFDRVFAEIPSIEKRLLNAGQDEYVMRTHQRSDPISEIIRRVEEYRTNPQIQHAEYDRIREGIVEITPETKIGKRIDLIPCRS
jgi:hypothetical protein